MGSVRKLILRTSLFYFGAVFGLVVGLLLSQLVIWTTIGAAVYQARVDQYEIDRAIFYKGGSYERKEN